MGPSLNFISITVTSASEIVIMWCGGSAVKSSKGDFQSHIELFAVGTFGEKKTEIFPL